jgi:hypothetical protein
MATFKLTPQAIDMEVSISADNLVTLFDSGLTELVEQRVRQSVSAGLVDAVNSRDYLIKMRDWLLESIDMRDMAEMMHRNLDYRQIVDAILPEQDEGIHSNAKFMRAFASNAYAVRAIESVVDEWLRSDYAMSKIEQFIESKSANMVNDVVERAMVVISQRLSGGSDV